MRSSTLLFLRQQSTRDSEKKVHVYISIYVYSRASSQWPRKNLNAGGTKLEIFSLDLSLASAHALIDTWQERPERPTGIYAFNDEYALCLLAALTDRGIQVPREMAIVGTDDSSTSQFVRPSLTSIGFGDGNALGQLAVEMLVNQ